MSRHAARGRRRPGEDPFALLGLPAEPEVSDDDVRSAWRRVAAATHPDRADGGDPDLFARAAAAYTALRTPSGRGEALADLAPARLTAGRAAGRRTGGSTSQDDRPAGTRLPRHPAGAAAALAARVRGGRPVRLALRVLGAAAVSAGAAAAVGLAPAALGLMTGAVTWLVITARHDLAPPGR